jgi:hypothetical protein
MCHICVQATGAGEGEERFGAHLRVDLQQVAQIRHAHAPVDVVAEEEQRVDTEHEHLLPCPVPAPITLLV